MFYDSRARGPSLEATSAIYPSVVLVSRGAVGIGAQMGMRLASAGVRVLLTDLDGDRGNAAADEIVMAGGGAVGAACDVTDPEACESKPSARFGAPVRADCLMVDVQLNGVFYFAQDYAKRMMDSGGSIVIHHQPRLEAPADERSR